ncbi:hypothetical protein Tco_1141065 [Tanacetum coccineum]
MLKPIPEDDRSVTPKLVWVIPTSHIPDAEKDWANALATTYQAMAENSLLEKNGDIRTFMNCKGCGQALSISKMKAARYHDFRLELLIPEHMWIDDNKSLLSLRVRLLKDITLRRADNQEYMIAEKDFKNLYPSDFEDLNLLLLQGHLNHLPGSDIRMLSTAVKLNNERKIMRFNEIYMFSDGTLTNIMEALDHRVKEYKVNRLNPGMNMRFWTNKDVERSKEFIHAIERRLKTKRIFWNLECFVGGRVRDIDYKLFQRTE